MRKPLKSKENKESTTNPTTYNLRRKPLIDKTNTPDLKRTVTTRRNKNKSVARVPRQREISRTKQKNQNEVPATPVKTPTVVSTKIRRRNKAIEASTSSRIPKIATRESTRNKTSIPAKKSENKSVLLDKTLRVSLERIKKIDEIAINHVNKFRKKFEKSPEKRKSNPLAVYEFDIDPDEEPTQKVKKHVRQRKIVKLNTPVVPKDRQKLSRKVKKPARYLDDSVPENNPSTPLKGNNKNTGNYNIMNKIVQEIELKIRKAKTKPVVTKRQKNPPKKIAAIQELPLINETAENSPPAEEVQSEPVVLNAEEQAKEEANEIVQSFVEDIYDEDSNAVISSPSRIDIITNLIARRRSPAPNFFNSTMVHHSPKPVSSPWRLEFSAIKKKPEYFSVKNSSFTPSYNPEFLSPSRRYDTNSFINISPDNNNKSVIKLDSNNKHQTSMLDFVKSSKQKNPKNNVQTVLFSEVTTKKTVNSSPRKVLGTLNYNQASLQQSLITQSASPNRKSQDDNMFGFTLLSDDDENKENVPNKRGSPKKQKKTKADAPTRISVNEIKKVVHDENIIKPVNEQPANPVPPVEPVVQSIDIEETDNTLCTNNDSISINLFEEPPEVQNPKRFSRHYTRKFPKRRRRFSIESVHSEDESDTEVTHVKKKHKDVLSKAEEKEAERLASHYNSMFEEIEQYPLCIE